MGFSDIFISAVDTAFTVFSDFVKSGKYIYPNAGWGSENESDDIAAGIPIDVIVNGMTQKDLRNSKFYSQITPTDTVVMIKGKDIDSNNIRVRNSDLFSITFKNYTQLFIIVDHETDAANALYLLLLREK